MNSNTRTFEDCVDVGGKVYDMKWEAEYVPAFKFDGYNRANEEGWELDKDSIRHSFFGMWFELPTVPKEAYEEMIAGMNRYMAATLCE